MATHSSILAWKIPWIEETGELYSPRSLTESDTTEQLSLFFPQGFQWCISPLLKRKAQKSLDITSGRGFHTVHWIHAGRLEENMVAWSYPVWKCWPLC